MSHEETKNAQSLMDVWHLLTKLSKKDRNTCKSVEYI